MLPKEPTPLSSVWWPGSALAVKDGDTFTALVRGPWYGRCELVIRLLGIQCPETNGPSKRKVSDAEHAAGVAAGKALADLVLFKPLLVRTVRKDPYDLRFDGQVVVDGVDVAAALIAKGHGCAYDGHGKAPRWVGPGRWEAA